MKKRCTKALAVLLAATIAFGTVDMSVFAQQTSTQTVTEETTTAEQGEEVASSVAETQAAEATTETMQSASDVVTESAAVEESVATEESVEEQEAFTLQESQTMEESAETQESTVAAESVVTQTNVVETVTEETSGISWDGVTTQQTYEGENYKITFLLDGYWNGGYNAKVKIQNTGNVAIENWYVAFDFANTVSNPWNAEVSSSENGSYVLKHASYNQDIAAGMTVEFGFGAREDFKGFPTECVLLGEETETNEEDYTVNYRLDRDWGDGFTGTITITNNSEQTIEDWRLEFDFERNITGIWNGVIESHEGSHYVIKNAGYNADIAPGQTVSFGFSGNGGSAANVPENNKLYSYDVMNLITISETGLILEEDGYVLSADFESFSGELKRAEEVNKFEMYVYDKNDLLIYQTEIVPEEVWSVETVGLIYGYNKVVFCASIGNMVDKKEIVVNCDTTIYFANLNIDLSDTDQDSLPNYIETYFGTGADVVDTDGDGLTDYQELYTFGYDPVNVDTDNDGILDNDEDEDADGISNGKEYEIGTDPLDTDTDNDKLEDNTEIEFGTSPILEDTDVDGVSDYEEYQLSEMNAVYDSQTGAYTAFFSADTMNIYYDEAVIPSITLTADAKGIMDFKMETVQSHFLFNPSMEGYIGAAYDFTTSGKMLGAKLTFTYNESLLDQEMLNSPDFCPTIYYYNPEEQSLMEVEGQVWEGNQVSVTLDHFSTYILVNKADMERLWNETLDIEDEKTLTSCNHVVFVMDRSSSMKSNDPNFIRTSLIREFCSRISGDDKIGLVGFSSSAVRYSTTLTGDKAEIEAAISLFESKKDSGGTNMNNGIYTAVNMLDEVQDPDAKKSILILTDGQTSSKLSSAYLEGLKSKNITIYTIGMGSVSKTYLQQLADSTGGKYFYATTSSDLSEIFIDFEDELDTDANNDGLNDNLTKLICQGKITTITGTKIFYEYPDGKDWELFYDDIMTSDDFDKDGLKNGEEIEIYYRNGKPYIKYLTSPEYSDSDCDFFTDYEETKVYNTDPLVENYIVASEDFLYVNNYANFESGKAYDDYIGGNTFGMTAEYLFNVIICGGESNINKKAREQLLNCLVSYVDADKLEDREMFKVAGDFLRGACDVNPDWELNLRRVEVMHTINQYQEEIRSLYRVPYSKERKKELKKKIASLKSEFSRYSENIMTEGSTSKLNGYGKSAGTFVTIVSYGVECVDDYVSYSAALTVLANYDDVLNELRYCGNKNVEVAATTVYRDVQDVRKKYITHTEDTLSNFGDVMLSNFYGVILEKNLKVKGLLIDLACLVADQIVGESISVKIENAISVDCANGIALATNNYLLQGDYVADTEGNVNMVVTGGAQSRITSRLWTIDIYARSWCEQNYLSYLGKDREWSMDDDFFLYKTPDSQKNAEDNVNKLGALYGTY